MNNDQMKKMLLLIESCSCESNKEELEEVDSMSPDHTATKSAEELAHVSDEALDNAYHYGRSSPGNSFGWQANVKSAEFAQKAILAGETDIEKISDAIHKGWNVTAKAFVSNPDQFSDTEKLRAAGKLEAKLAQREKLMNIEYAQLPEDEKEKDRVVARALYKAIKGEELGADTVDEDFDSFMESIQDMLGGLKSTTLPAAMSQLGLGESQTQEEVEQIDEAVEFSKLDTSGAFTDQMVYHNGKRIGYIFKRNETDNPKFKDEVGKWGYNHNVMTVMTPAGTRENTYMPPDQNTRLHAVRALLAHHKNSEERGATKYPYTGDWRAGIVPGAGTDRTKVNLPKPPNVSEDEVNELTQEDAEFQSFMETLNYVMRKK